MLQAFHIFQLNMFLIFNRLFSLLTHYATSCTPSPWTFRLWIQRLLLLQMSNLMGWREVFCSMACPVRMTGSWRNSGGKDALFTLRMRKTQRCSGVPSSSPWAERIHSLDLQLKRLYVSPFPPKGGCIEGEKPTTINEPKLFKSGCPSLSSTPDLFQVLLPGLLRKFWKIELARGDLANKRKI